LQIPVLPSDEEERLQALSILNILDSAPEERFDRLTRLAKKMFDVPISLVSLVDKNRQWFKSHDGLDVTETSRDISFCAHAILHDKTFIVNDTLSDARFADNPLVTNDPHIRFYAGCPLKAPNGLNVGTLCIIDNKPRDFCAADLASLQDLVALVECELAAIHLATIDDLTGISNRRGFTLHAKQILRFSHAQAIPTSLVFMDLNKFKQINDQFGHAIGNHALKTFAALLQKASGQSDLLARSGGDEFLALLADAKQQDAIAFIDRLSSAINQCNATNQLQYKLSFAYGIVESNPMQPACLHELISESDRQMYQQKQSAAKETPVSDV
jgi:diguanylate cyclase (GGDEF)-like protein